MLSCPKCAAPCLQSHRFCPACGHDLAGSPASLRDEPLIGTTVGGKFILRELIGSGGMGKVFRAEQKGVGRSVAVKIMHRHLLGDATAAARFTNEARAASALNHLHSIAILDFGQTEAGMLYIVMEYLKGRSLDIVLHEEYPLPLGRLAHIMLQALDAVEAAHRQQIIHRDLKPENIFLINHPSQHDYVKVLDFGIAKILDLEARGVTTPGLVPGTPEYMSPEQARGEPLDARTDIYSMGVIWYEMLTNSVPFKGASAIVTMMAHVQDPLEPPSKRRPDAEIPAALEAIVTWALAKDPNDRITSAAQFRDIVSAWAQVANILPSGLDPRASSPDVLLEFLSEEELTKIPEQIADGQRVGDVSDTSPTAGRYPVVREVPPLTGRSAFVRKLHQWVDGDAPQILALVGQTGLGKSRLVDEAIRYAEVSEKSVCVGRPNAGWVAQPLTPIREIALGCLSLDPSRYDTEDLMNAAADIGLSAADLPGLEDIFGLPNPLASLEHESRDRERRAAFRRLVSLASKRAPLRLIFEDINLYDEPSREAVLDLMRWPAPDLFLLCTLASARDLFLPDGIEVLGLEALSDKESASLVNAMFGEHIQSGPLASIVSAATGHPLFLEQMAYAIAQQGLVEPPDGLPDLVATRFACLIQQERDLLQWMAVINRVISPAKLSTISGHSVKLSDMQSLKDRGFLAQSGEHFAFCHRLVAMVVHSSIPAEVRREMHQKVAERLRRSGAAAGVVGYHAYEADDGPRAIHELEQAAKWCLRCLDFPGAIRHYRWALDLVRREWGRGRIPAEELDKTAVDLAVQLSEALQKVSDYQSAEGILEEILSVAAGDDGARARLRLNLGRIDLYRDKPQRALRHLLLACADARAGRDPWLLSEVSRELARAKGLLGDTTTAERLLDESVASQPDIPPPEAERWLAVAHAADTCAQIGLPDRAKILLIQALEIAEIEAGGAAKARLLSRQAEVHLGCGEWSEAEHSIHQGLDLVRKIGDRSGQAELLITYGRLRRILGDHEGGAVQLRAAEDLCGALGWEQALQEIAKEKSLLQASVRP